MKPSENRGGRYDGLGDSKGIYSNINYSYIKPDMEDPS